MLWRSQSADAHLNSSDDESSPKPHQHIYLLPRSSTFHSPGTPKTADDNEIFVYAPVPLSSMSPHQAQNLRTTATEAWISHIAPDSASSAPHSARSVRSHRHGHRRHGSASSGSHGRICLPVQPQEGLLPGYEQSMRQAPSTASMKI